MKTENTEQIEASTSVAIEDLTLNETDSENVRAGGEVPLPDPEYKYVPVRR